MTLIGYLHSFKCRLKLLNRPLKLKVPMARFFSRKYLAYHVYKAIPEEDNFRKLKTRLFLGPEMLLFLS